MVQRNHGLDGLRILSMFMVVVLHVLGVGGVLDQTPPLSVRYWAAWGLEIACYCAVNCFVLISGCVLSSSRFRSARLIELWLQTVFYSFGISLLFFLLRPGTLSPAALGVYLIHVCPPVWNHLLSGAFSSLAHHSTPLLVLLVLAAALTIYLVCSAIELLRIRLFRLLGLSALCQRAGDWLDRRFCLSP